MGDREKSLKTMTLGEPAVCSRVLCQICIETLPEQGTVLMSPSSKAWEMQDKYQHYKYQLLLSFVEKDTDSSKMESI